MESIYWHSGGRRHWQADPADWLCIRLDRDPGILSVVLQEDTHHYFSDWYAFDANQQPCEEHLLDGPGPHHLPAERLAGCILLVRARFLGYSRRPFQAEGGSRETLCGEAVHDSGGSIPLLMQTDGDPAGLRPPAVPTQAADALRALMNLGEPPPPIELRAAQGPAPFRLRHPAPFDTTVFVLEDQTLPPAVAPGAEVRWSDLRDDLPRVRIAANTLAPGGRTVVQGSVALPVLQLNEQVGLVGRPLALARLITDPVGWLSGTHVWTRWQWRGPRSWVKVSLSWDLYQGERWADIRQERVVSRQEYERSNGIQLFTCDPSYVGWDVEISGTPLLHGEPVPDQQFSILITL